MKDIYQKINFIFDKKDKKVFFYVFLFSVLISLIEAVGVSLIMPFMSVAGNFDLIHSNEYYKIAYDLFNIQSSVDFVIYFGLFLVFYYIFRGFINLFYTYKLSEFSEGRFYKISSRLFHQYINMFYKDFITKNTSVLTKVLVSEVYNLTHVISSMLLMISELIIVMALYSLMLWVDWKVTLVFTLFLGLKAFFLTKKLTPKIRELGNERESYHKKYYEVINTTFRNFKYIKLLSTKITISDQFRKHSLAYVKTNIIGATLSQVPKVFLEMIGFTMLIVLITYIVYKEQTDISGFLPIITMYVLALYRLLPSVNRIMNSYNQINFYNKTTNIVFEELSSKFEKDGDDKLVYNSKIEIKDLSYSFTDSKVVLDKINMTICKGDKIGIKGESGSGKTTLVDMIIGLYKPSLGNILVDGIELNENNISNWRSHIGYIPQAVYLFEGSVAENVVFGREYDEEKIIKVLKAANIYDFLMTKGGINTSVGDAGVMLSGGQQQRIAIARALYSDPDILVLDEATSALDDKTESSIMEEIYSIGKDKTLIIIAHRLSSLNGCNKIFEISHGKIIKG
ncbi:ATP-binding cassette domain-containing protein [Sulfurimonas sp.]|uniref:ABC transporter ATP-binding protein/permease n=1 Tax=Sulfurimonas sp. TaxID=2022749 RepID=UPI003568B7FF